MTQVISAEIDPNEYHIRKGASPKRLREACGLIPEFYLEAAMRGNETAQELYDAMTSIYGFGSYEEAFRGGSVDSDGVYQSQFEEDPPMVPLLKLGGEGYATLYIYQHAMLALVDDEKTIVTRMD